MSRRRDFYLKAK